ncbi:MAG: N-acetylmuramoyl-L-alanine amidase [Acidobacteriota bacterium]
MADFAFSPPPHLRRVLCGWLLLVMTSLGSLAAQGLEIQSQGRTHRLRAVIRRGEVYYRLNPMAKALNLHLSERRGLWTLSGPRGSLELTDGRPLVRFGDQYILVSLPIWKRSSRDWYVPEDFITNAVPLLLTTKLEKVADRRYRVEEMDRNEVGVQVVNYPDHVSIIFLPSRHTSIRVTEFQRLIKVAFDEYLVKPKNSGIRPNPRIVSALKFNYDDVHGSFDIVKGSQYDSFREYSLGQPSRRVIDVYAAPVASDNATESPARESPAWPDARVQPIDQAAPEFQPSESLNVITIDPGHGGEDYGVRPYQEMLEKTLTRSIANRIEQQLGQTRYQALLTRLRDTNMVTEQRSSLGNHNRSVAFVSIHFGSSPRPEAAGPTVYIHHCSAVEKASRDGLMPWGEGQRKYLPRSRQLALFMQEELNHLFGTKNRVVEAPLAVLAPVAAPAVLVEAGVLSNAGDRQRLSDEDFQRRVAQSIVNALLRFLP